MSSYDHKFKTNKARYLLQCLLPAVASVIMLLLLNTVAGMAIAGALAASAFVAFVLPERKSADPRNLIGGHVTGLIAGMLCYWLSRVAITFDIPISQETTLIIFAGLAVWMAVLGMAVFNTEHPPAVGVAFGLVLNGGTAATAATAAVVLGAIICVAGLKRLLKPVLIDLL